MKNRLRHEVQCGKGKGSKKINTGKKAKEMEYQTEEERG